MDMKNIALPALTFLTLVFSPAQAELTLDLGGYTRGYVLYVDQQGPPGANKAEFRRDTELHIGGRKTLDNETVAGFHNELKTGTAGGDTGMNEIHFYYMGAFGRINAGQEDGAAYLLQVTAPSADDNIDGFRTQINGLNRFAITGAIDYDHADFTRVERVTYLTPRIGGFQAGISYAPSAAVYGRNIAGMTSDILEGYENIYDAAFRWDGAAGPFKIGIGTGYSEGFQTTGLTADRETWNVGLHLAWREISAGVSYLTTNNARLDGDGINTWVAGLGFDRGDYHLGLSFLSKNDENEMTGTATRLTFGGGYSLSDGVSLRASLAAGEDQMLAENEYTQFAVGTEIEF